MKLYQQTGIVIIMTMVLLGCGSTQKMQSQWRDRAVSIDGMTEEWQGSMKVLENKDISIGLLNDADFLYVNLTTSDQNLQRQFMMNGFVLWFDPDGGKEKKFGIKFPLGMREMGVLRGPGRNQEFETMREDFEKSLDQIEFILPEQGETLRMAVSEAKGVEVKVGPDRERLTYEVKVPLFKSPEMPYAVQAKDKKPLGVGFETVELDFNKLREQIQDNRPPGGGPRGGFGGGRGGFGGGRGGFGGRGGRAFERPEQFKLWAQIELSNAADGSSAKILQPEKLTSAE